LALSRDVRNKLFWFNLLKNSDSVQNEFGSVRFKKRGFSDIIVIYYSCNSLANITAIVDDMTLTSLTTTMTSK